MPPLPGTLGVVMLSDGAGYVTNSSDLSFNAIPSAQATGTLDAVEGNTGVTGTGTKFEYELRNGTQLGDLGTISQIVSDTYLLLEHGASGSTGPTVFASTPYNELLIEGDLVPKQPNIYNLGNSTNYWRSLHVGPGTIAFSGVNGQSALLGLDNYGTAYFNTGVSVSSLNVGHVNPIYGAVDGWNLTATGTAGTPGYDLIAQQISPVPGGGLTGPITSLLHAPTGSTGPQGAPGGAGTFPTSVVHTQTHTVAPTDVVILFHYVGSGGVIALPSAATSLNRVIYIKNLNTTNNGTRIQAVAGELVEGVDHFHMTNYAVNGFNPRAQITLICGSDGGNTGGNTWWVLSSA
jgi:hypothetical protein